MNTRDLAAEMRGGGGGGGGGGGVREGGGGVSTLLTDVLPVIAGSCFLIQVPFTYLKCLLKAPLKPIRAGITQQGSQ